jgi:hypothetical protein
MRRGNELRAARDFEGALNAYRAADDIMHVPTTGFEVARSEVQLGQLVEASDTLARLARIPEQPDEAQAFKDARTYARMLNLEIGPRIPKIRLRVDAGAGAHDANDITVSVDGQNIPITAFDIPYAVDPGKHAIIASTTDGRMAKQEVLLREGDESEVALVLAPPTPTPPAPVVAHEAPIAPTPTHTGIDRRTVAWIAFGTAGAAVIVGGATGVVSWARANSASARCNGNQCPPSTYADIDTAHTLATASTISFITAGVAAAVGAATLLTAPRVPQVHARASAGLRIAPWVGVGAAGITGAF